MENTELKKAFANEITRLLHLPENTPQFKLLDEAFKQFKPQSAIVRYGWQENSHISFTVAYNTGGTADALQTFLDNLPDVEKVYPFLMSLKPEKLVLGNDFHVSDKQQQREYFTLKLAVK